MQDALVLTMHGNEFRFMRPSRDETGEVQWIKPLNMELAYAQLASGEWALVDTAALSDWPRQILSRHSSPDEMRKAFFVEQERRSK